MDSISNKAVKDEFTGDCGELHGKQIFDPRENLVPVSTPTFNDSHHLQEEKLELKDITDYVTAEITEAISLPGAIKEEFAMEDKETDATRENLVPVSTLGATFINSHNLQEEKSEMKGITEYATAQTIETISLCSAIKEEFAMEDKDTDATRVKTEEDYLEPSVPKIEPVHTVYLPEGSMDGAVYYEMTQNVAGRHCSFFREEQPNSGSIKSKAMEGTSPQDTVDPLSTCKEEKCFDIKDQKGNMTIVGLALGPVQHFFYKYIDYILPKRTLQSVCKKILLDQTICSPCAIFIFFYGLGILEDGNFKRGHSEMKDKFFTIYVMDWIVWPPTQYINFKYLSTKYRVVYINFITMLYDVFLSYVKYDE